MLRNESGVILPWPPRELHPNARVHFHARAKAARAYREQCYWIAKADGERVRQDTASIRIHLTFYPPDKRRRDLDGMLSNVKHGLDAIADAWEVNDYRFELLLTRAESRKGGEINVTLE